MKILKGHTSLGWLVKKKIPNQPKGLTKCNISTQHLATLLGTTCYTYFGHPVVIICCNMLDDDENVPDSRTSGVHICCKVLGKIIPNKPTALV